MKAEDARFSKRNVIIALPGNFQRAFQSAFRVTSSGSSRENATRVAREERERVGERDGRVDETKTEATTAAAAAAAEVVDGGGVCRDKYLPVNTERLALPSRSIPMRAANDMHSRGRNV